MTWQTLETAPKDGRFVKLGWLDWDGTVLHTETARWTGDPKNELGWVAEGQQGFFTPTHWKEDRHGRRI